MSEISDNAHVSLMLADYANTDASNKLNMLGAGWMATALQASGQTPPHALVVLIEVPPRHYGEEFAVTLTLTDEAGEPVKVGGPTGSPETLRIQQLVKADRPSVAQLYVPPHRLPGRVQLVLNFANGIPLAAGQIYRWAAEIDGNKDDRWQVSFLVAGPPPAPVLG
jgi:hypothetical protein